MKLSGSGAGASSMLRVPGRVGAEVLTVQEVENEIWKKLRNSAVMVLDSLGTVMVWVNDPPLDHPTRSWRKMPAVTGWGWTTESSWGGECV